MFRKNWLAFLTTSRTNPARKPYRRSQSRTLVHRPVLERLEDRQAPAVFTDGGTSTLTITLNTNEALKIEPFLDNYNFATNQTHSNGGVANSGDFSSFGTNQIFLNASGLARYDTIRIVDAGANASVEFIEHPLNPAAFTDHFQIVLDDPAAGAVKFSGKTAFAGANGLDAMTTRQIVFTSGSRLASVNGSITLRANVGGSGVGSYLDGVFLDNSSIESTGSGKVTVSGQARGNGQGVNVVSGSTIVGGTGGTEVHGIAGDGSGAVVRGVTVYGTGSKISSNGGNVLVTGQGSSGGGDFAIGVAMLSGGSITAVGAGTVTVNGIGGTGGGGSSWGVEIGVGSQITSGGGNIQVTGTEGGGPGSPGLAVHDGATITTAANGGTITLIGDQMFFGASATIAAQSNSSVTLRPRSSGVTINLGAADGAGTLGLTDVELDRVTAGTVNIGGAGLNPIIVSSAITHGNHLTLATGGGITFAQAVTMSADKNLTANATGTINLSTSASDLAASGTGAIAFTTARDITLASGSSITTTNGNLALSANQQATPTAGDFAGVRVNGGIIQATGAGVVTVQARGGNSAGSQDGVRVQGGGKIIGGTSGLLTVYGTGGASGDDINVGVEVIDTGSTITSNGAGVQVIGTGGGAGGSRDNTGVLVKDGGQITAGGSAGVTIVGQGGASGSGISNHGVQVNGAGALITSSGGNVSVTGAGGGVSSSRYDIGVLVEFGGQITAGGGGTVTVTGRGGILSTVSENRGVYVLGANAKITSSGGNVLVAGTGGGSGFSANNVGVEVAGAGEITAGGIGSVTVIGKGGLGASSNNSGVTVNGTNSRISSSGGSVSVTGAGGGSAGNFSSFGVYAINAGTITAGGTGTVTVSGLGGAGTSGSNIGVHVLTNSIITSSGGDVSVTGAGGGSGGSAFNYGVYVLNAGTITAGSTGTVTVSGLGGGASGNNNLGVFVQGTNSIITSGGGNVLVTGSGGGTASAASNIGVVLDVGGRITAGGTGTVTIAGKGGSGSGSSNQGVLVTGTNSKITSGGGNVLVTGTGGGTGFGTNNEGVRVNVAGEITAGGAGAVTVVGQGGLSSGGFNHGVLVLNPNSRITSSGGDVSVTGTGGGTGTGPNNFGVALDLGGLVIAGGIGTVNVVGKGGTTSSGSFNVGVVLFSSGTTITSSGGSVSVTGTGGGAGSSATNHGVNVESGAQITAGGAGTVAVVGQGGVTSTGPDNHGVRVNNFSSRITSSGGNLSVTGAQGGGSGSTAIVAENSGSITTLASGGAITLVGDSMRFTAPATINTKNTSSVMLLQRTNGVAINLGGADGPGTLGLTDAELDRITTGSLYIGNASSGAITVSADVNLTNNASLLRLMSGATVTATAGGIIVPNLAVHANGNINFTDSTTDVDNVALNSQTGSITFQGDADGFNVQTYTEGFLFLPGVSAPGNIDLGSGDSITVMPNVSIATGGSSTITLTAARYINVAPNASVVAVNGSLTLSANQQATPSTGNFVGVRVDGGRVQATGTGAVTVQGKGGDDAGGFQTGVLVQAGGQIIGGAGAVLTVDGAGGPNSGAFNRGVHVLDAGSTITSNGGLVAVTGVGGNAGNFAITVEASGAITATNGGTLMLNGDSMDFHATAAIGGPTTSIVTLRPRTGGLPILLGGADSPTRLALTDAELDRITGGVLVIGDAASGTITVSADITLPGKNVTLFTGAGVTGTGRLTPGGAAQTTLTINQAGNSTYGGRLGGDGANENHFGLIKTGTGALTLSGNNTYDGVTQVLGGTLAAASSGALGSVIGGTVVAAGATLDVTADVGFENLAVEGTGVGNGGALVTSSGTGVVRGVVQLRGNTTIGGAGILTLNGSILGNFTVTKTGSGSLIHNGTSSHVSTVVVNGTLGGAGTHSAVQVSGGTLAPGVGTGTFTVTNLSFNSGIFAVEINGLAAGAAVGGHDQLRATGAIDVTGATLQLNLGYAPVIGDSFTILDNQGGAAITGNFVGLPEGEIFFLGGKTYQISYVGGSNKRSIAIYRVIVGTPNNDVITIKPNSDPKKLDVIINNAVLETVDLATITGVVKVLGLAGNDKITVDAKITKNFELSGGAGDDVLTGGSGNDILIGGANNDTLVGGKGNDLYVFADAWGVDKVTDSAGVDLFDFSAATQAVTFTRGSTLTARSGVHTVVGAQIEGVIGGTGNDTLASTSSNIWNLTKTNAGTLNATFTFTGIENLTGGSSTDLFKFSTGGALTGVIIGAGGVNTLDYSGRTTAVNVNLQAQTATDMAGFTGINAVKGGSASDTLIGANVALTWSITGNNSGKMGTATFSSIENLTGGSLNDSFVFASGKSISGIIDGGDGVNSLNYAAYATSVLVNLKLGTATGTAGIARIRNVTGGKKDDILVGDDLANILIGGSGRDILIGGLGADTLDGQAGDDILIGGNTNHDTNLISLNLLMAEWSRALPHADRVAHLRGTSGGGFNGTVLLDSSTVHNDAASDKLIGGADADWFLFSGGDVLHDKSAAEIATEII